MRIINGDEIVFETFIFYLIAVAHNAFNIRDDKLQGRPLYLDAQATTTLVITNSNITLLPNNISHALQFSVCRILES